MIHWNHLPNQRKNRTETAPQNTAKKGTSGFPPSVTKISCVVSKVNKYFFRIAHILSWLLSFRTCHALWQKIFSVITISVIFRFFVEKCFSYFRKNTMKKNHQKMRKKYSCSCEKIPMKNAKKNDKKMTKIFLHNYTK